jgi:hypothetical protein
MRLRITCRTLVDEILDAVITTKVIEQVAYCVRKCVKIENRFDLISRYLHHRVSTERSSSQPWITAIRETSRPLAKLSKSGDNAMELKFLERSVCACFAAEYRVHVFDIVVDSILIFTRAARNLTLGG